MRYLVVARWQEDVSWVDELDGWEPFIVEKDRDVPNAGREASSYLWACAQLHPRLHPDDRVAFVQGTPFDHCQDVLEQIQGEFELEWHPLGNWHVSDGTGRPDHPDLPVAEKYPLWVGGEFPGSVDFVAGAQFVVKANRILRRSAEEYDRLARAVCCIDKGAWVMERLWLPFFGG